MKNNVIEIHTTQVNGAVNFYKSIDASCFLVNQLGGADTLNVYFHPVYLEFRIAMFAKKTMKSFIGNWRGGTFKNKRSVYGEFQSKKFVDLHIVNGVKVNFKKEGYGVRSYLSAIFPTVNLILDCYSGFKFDCNKALSLEYGRIVIGDLVASTSLRRSGKAGGNIKKSKISFMLHLFNAVTIMRYCSEKGLLSIGDNKIDRFFMTNDPMYICGIYKRIVVVNGGRILETHSNRAEYDIMKSGEYANPFFCKRRDESVSESDSFNVSEYLKKRFSDPSGTLAYMFYGTNKEYEYLLDKKGKEIEIRDGLSVVIFLHSFSDAQYVFGKDCFCDLYDWVNYTIGILLQNKNVTRIFIKQHPNIDFDIHEADLVAIRRIERKYTNISKVVWLATDVSPRSLNKKINFVGITHHGSIAEELAFLGVKVIASTYAPWGGGYNFLYSWSSLEEYRDLLLKLSLTNNSAPLGVDSELVRYVCDYRLNDDYEPSNRVFWMKYKTFFDDFFKVGSDNRRRKSTIVLNQLSSGQKEFNALMEKITQAHSSKSLKHEKL